MRHVRLGINIDHVATLRNARGGLDPDPIRAAQLALVAGADGITLHLREDRRHIRDADLTRLCASIVAPVNLEIAATTDMLDIALRHRPHAVCLVPERRAEVTTEGGLDLVGQFDALLPMVRQLSHAGIRVSMFIDPDLAQVEAAARLQAPVVELHTGSYARSQGLARSAELSRLHAAAVATERLGIECHAGHGLNFDNVGPVAAIEAVRELNIGHFLVGEAVFMGLGPAIVEMRRRITAAACGAGTADEGRP